MKYFVWILVVALLIAHQDNWNWNDDRLVFGFMPMGMFYHVLISLAAGFVWFLVCVFAWPCELKEDDPIDSNAGSKGGQAS